MQISIFLMPKAMSNSEFIEKARLVHGEKYSYANTLYTRATMPVIITCAKHGDFSSVPSRHLSGNGCRGCWLDRCGTYSRLSKDEFIDKSKEIHGDLYDYSKVEYIKNISPVEIVCKIHGAFKQKPMVHLAGSGCQECGKIKKSESLMKDVDFYIERAKIVHGDRYDYSKSSYEAANSKIEIICSRHGSFWMTPNAHTNGQGCSKCADEFNARKRMKPFSLFVEQANSKHQSKYSYVESSYSGDARKLEIICGDHGSFMQSPNRHLQGSGCPKCSISGFDVGKPAYLYLLESDCGKYIKIGIANKLRDRQTKLRKRTPFCFDHIHTFSSGGHEIAALEKHYHSKLESCGFRYFDGCTEWFRFDKDIVEEIKRL